VTDKFIAPVLALVFGLLIGSFLNVCIHRWPRGRSVIKPRSHCVRCRAWIAWYDNIPVLSYILLGGRCRHCHRHISLRYPTVELMTGLLWGWFVLHYGAGMQAAKMCVFASILVALTFSDLEKRLLPDQLTKGGMWLGFAFALFVGLPDVSVNLVLWGVEMVVPQPVGHHLILTGRWDWIAESLFGAAVPSLLLWGLGSAWSKMRGKETLGFGDVKLVAMVGSFVGLAAALMTLLIGACGGAVLGVIFIKATGKKLSEYELPFGTFLGLAGLAVALWWPGWFAAARI